ncbi:hypothetical protein [Mycobacterium uberis]
MAAIGPGHDVRQSVPKTVIMSVPLSAAFRSSGRLTDRGRLVLTLPY